MSDDLDATFGFTNPEDIPTPDYFTDAEGWRCPGCGTSAGPASVAPSGITVSVSIQCQCGKWWQTIARERSKP